MKRKSLKPQQVVVMYMERHLTMAQIAAVVGCSPVAIWKILHAAGVDIQDATNPIVSCSYCGTAMRRPRSRLHATMYCCPEHRYAAMERPGAAWIHSRIPRAIVSQWFELRPDHVVHHKDLDWRNNDRANLAIYANQDDLTAMQHGRDVLPLWDGSMTELARP